MPKDGMPQPCAINLDHVQEPIGQTTADLFAERSTRAARRIPAGLWPIVRRKLKWLDDGRLQPHAERPNWREDGIPRAVTAQSRGVNAPNEFDRRASIKRSK